MEISIAGPRLVFGADYNPEQWPESTWADDILLMKRAHVTNVNLGIFSWGLLEVDDGVFEWGWLDRIMDALADADIGVNLATPTAAPPQWLWQKHPEIGTVSDDGVRTGPGGRLGWSPSSQVFRRYALRMVRALAERYASHSALRLWHVSNELGNENAYCYSDETGNAWREWLRGTYTTIDRLNDAWGTAFWGHTYTSFGQIQPPRTARTSHNPGLLLDFDRFSSDALLAHYEAERAVLRDVTPEVPVTTNFMIMSTGHLPDYAKWAGAVDFVANDHYPFGGNPDRLAELAFSASRTRGVASGGNWLLMEHATSAVNWQGVNHAKAPGDLARDSLTHVAHGADGVMFFQWRASTAGAEQFHSAIVPHRGADSRIFREVEELGARLEQLAEVRGTSVEQGSIALVLDQTAIHAIHATRGPTSGVDPYELAHRWHRHLIERGFTVDVITPHARLDGYEAVLVPYLFLTADDLEPRLAAFARAGGHVLVSFGSGIVDETMRVRGGGYPGAFRELLGAVSDEVHPLPQRAGSS
ncbi:beta-galactosidase [Naasia aerilata]|uniref:beta-galactosidase n=1 Tax=Naasia aerilata TaxID=1162966 RepID=A0ABN6XMI4_9MICO|nr:beta-galactosidase [Naasia aerilata]BDZ46138.1 beta-galactosidase [Naasia aerilata]